jgi:hypothetical protein
MKKIYIIAKIALICGIGLSVGAYAMQGTNIWDKIFNKDIDNITFDELKTARDELIKSELSPEEFDERGKKLKEAIIEKEKELPEISDKKQDIDTLIERIKRDIAFFEESIKYDQTINDKVRERQEIHLEKLKKFLPLVETKEKSYEEYFSEYENLRLKYIEDYKKLRD